MALSKVVILERMLVVCGTLLTVASFAAPVFAKFKVDPYCTASDTPLPSYFRVISDESPSGVYADCANGTTYSARTYDNVEYTLNVYYSGDPTQVCVFNDKHYNTLFWIGVRIVAGGFIQLETYNYVMTCTLGRHTSNFTDERIVDESDTAPIEIQQNVGLEAISSFQLRIQNVKELFMEGIIPLGKKIRLCANASGAAGEAGIRPLSCVATNSAGYAYSVLRAGCGDGYVFPRNTGFTTDGLVVTSRYFKAFRLRGSREISFQCNFTVCNATCNGDSCSLEVLSGRKRRDALDESTVFDAVATAQTKPFFIEGESSIASSPNTTNIHAENEIIPEIIEDSPEVVLSGDDFILLDEAGKENLDGLDRDSGPDNSDEMKDTGLFLVLGLSAAILLITIATLFVSRALRRRETNSEPPQNMDDSVFV